MRREVKVFQLFEIGLDLYFKVAELYTKIQYTLHLEFIFLNRTFDSKLGHDTPLPFSTSVCISYVKEQSQYICQYQEVNIDLKSPVVQR